jgi:hypothetical protein
MAKNAIRKRSKILHIKNHGAQLHRSNEVRVEVYNSILFADSALGA